MASLNEDFTISLHKRDSSTSRNWWLLPTRTETPHLSPSPRRRISALLPINWLCMAIAVGAYVRALSMASITFVSTVLAGEHAVDQAPDVATEILVEEPCELIAIDIEAGVNHLAGRTATEFISDVVTSQRNLHEVVVVLAAGEVDADEGSRPGCRASCWRLGRRSNLRRPR
jgi:hypothetical protein